MSKTVGNLSFCLGVYNEAPIVLVQLQKIKQGLSQRFEESSFEFVIVDNGSTDGTVALLGELRDPVVKFYSLPQRGLGAALKLAFEKAKYDRMVFSAIDLPFSFTDLDEALKYWDDYDLIFGSKSHPSSLVQRPFKRKLASLFHRLLIRIFFDVKIRDTQGSLFLKRSSIKSFMSYCDAKNAFFCTQIAIYASLFKLKILEVPVFLDPELRASKFDLLKDGWSFLVSLVREYPKYLLYKRGQSKL